MKKCLKIFVTTFLFCILGVGFCYAGETVSVDQIEKEIAATLVSIENNKDKFGLRNIDFRDLSFGSGINTYICIDGKMEESNIFYPLIYNNNIIAFCIRNKIEGPIKMQITTALVDEINKNIKMNTKFALVYDDKTCYIYTNEVYKPIYTYNIPIVERDSLRNYSLSNIKNILIKSSDYETNIITTNSIDINYKINFNKISATSVFDDYVDVSYVPQSIPGEENSFICWAATTACIANTKRTNKLTAKSVASQIPWQEGENIGGVSYNHSILLNRIPSVMKQFTGKDFSKITVKYSEKVVYNNMKNKWPIHAVFHVSQKNYHSVTIYGVCYDPNKDSGNFYYIMDPEFGTTLAFEDSLGDYYYTSASSNNNLKLASMYAYLKTEN